MRVNKEQLAALEDMGVKCQVIVYDVQLMLKEMEKDYKNQVREGEREREGERAEEERGERVGGRGREGGRGERG